MNPMIMDYGPEPYVANLETISEFNDNFRSALWTGEHLQVVLMSILPGEDIGLEEHPELDQFILIEDGKGTVKMGDTKDDLDYETSFYEEYAIIIPAGKWHNIINTGDIPIKLVTIYAPPEHPRGTMQKDKPKE
ncbi:cupin domain-containing protein [Anaerovorax sp. IOR16]|uniref:cupin domain-containing protein n=1 Tax=Anaerovorax sp. IOR16 TaxID=2773458 RepID=UPI002ED1FE93